MCVSRSNLDSEYVSQIPRLSTASTCKSPCNSMYKTLLGSFCLLLSRHWCNAGFIFIIDFVNEAHPGIPWSTERHKATFMEWELAVLWFRVSKRGRNIPNIHGDWNFVYERMTTITTVQLANHEYMNTPFKKQRNKSDDTQANYCKCKWYNFTHTLVYLRHIKHTRNSLKGVLTYSPKPQEP